jgi:DNA polymerase elongation subunit (family B)
MKIRPPKVILFDIETAPSLGYFWGELYDTNIIGVERPWFMISYSWKVLGERKIHTKALNDYVGYRKDLEDDSKLVADLYKVFDAADILIAHNGDKFDVRKTNARFIKHNMKPPSTYKTIDTLKAARRFFKFESNKLDTLAQYLGVGKKIPNTGFSLWKRCMVGDVHAWNIMKRYNRHDIVLLERVYNKLRPYITNHPNMVVYDGLEACPACRSMHITRQGFRVSQVRKYARFHCEDCGHWFQGHYIPSKHVAR